MTEVAPVDIPPALHLLLVEMAPGRPVQVMISCTVADDATVGPLAFTSGDSLGHGAQLLESGLWAWVHGGAIGLLSEFEAHPTIWRT